MNTLVPLPPAVSCGKTGVVSLRRGTLQLAFADVETLRAFVRRAFMAPGVRRLRVDQTVLRVEVEFPFSHSKGRLLRKLAMALRNSPTAPVAESLLEAERFQLVRTRGGVTSWNVRFLLRGRVVAHHPLLRGSLPASLAVEQALALLPGVTEVAIHPLLEEVVFRYDSKAASRADVVAALEGAVRAVRPTANFLPPTRAGYVLDAAQVAASSAALVAPLPFAPAAAVLLCAAYAPQLRAGLSGLALARVDWNTVVTGVVGLTIWNGGFLAAALMSLALRAWRSLEHHEVSRRLHRLRSIGSASRYVDRLATCALAHGDAGVRAVRLANRAAVPTFAAGALGLAIAGTPAALAALRPDYLSAPRLRGRLEMLDFLEASIREGCYPISPAVADRSLRARIALRHPEAPELERMEGVEWESLPDLAPAEQVAWMESRLSEEKGTILYAGAALPFSPLLRGRMVWWADEIPVAYESEAPDVLVEAWRPEVVARFHRISEQFMRRRTAAETLPLAANSTLTLLGAFNVLGPAAVALATNAVTALMWWATHRSTGKPKLAIR